MSVIAFPLIDFAPINFEPELHFLLEELEMENDEYSLEEYDAFIKQFPDCVHLHLLRATSQLTHITQEAYRRTIENLLETYPDALPFKLEYCFLRIREKASSKVMKSCLAMLAPELAALRREKHYHKVIGDNEYHQLLFALAHIAALTDNEKLIEELFCISLGCPVDVQIELAYRLKGLERDYFPPLEPVELDLDLQEIFPVHEMNIQPHYKLSYDILNKGFFFLNEGNETELLQLDTDKLESDLRWVLAQGTQRIEYYGEEFGYLIVVFHIAIYTGIYKLASELLVTFVQLSEYDDYQIFGDRPVELMLPGLVRLAKVDPAIFLDLLKTNDEDTSLKYSLMAALGHVYKDGERAEVLSILDKIKDQLSHGNPDNIFWFALAMGSCGVDKYKQWITEQYEKGVMDNFYLRSLDELFEGSDYEDEILSHSSLSAYFAYLQELFFHTKVDDYNATILNTIAQDREQMVVRLEDLEGMNMFGDTEQTLMQLPLMHESPKIGRNDPCPCGSGDKYKKCCWNKLS